MDIPPLSGSRQAVVTLREHSLLCEGPRLFNALPASLRRTDWSLPTFKAHLDSYVQTLPDAPVSPGTTSAATDLNGHYSNSLRDWITAVRRDPSLSLDPEWNLDMCEPVPEPVSLHLCDPENLDQCVTVCETREPCLSGLPRVPHVP